MKAVIPAAGLGTRFLPYTKAQPKEMIPVLDKPALQFVVEEAVESGVQDILIVTGRGKQAIEDHFDANPDLERYLAQSGLHMALEGLRKLMTRCRIMYIRQPEPRGLGDAILHSETFVGNAPFVVLLGDDITIGPPPCTQVLRDAHQHLNGSVLAMQRVSQVEIERYGMIVGKEIEPGIVKVEDLIEKPSRDEVRSQLATIGRYILTPTIFESLRNIEPGRNQEIQLTDAIRLLLETEDVYGVLYPGKRYDVGNKVGWLRATLELAIERDDLRRELRDVLAILSTQHRS